MFKVGQRVWDMRFGWGEIVQNQKGVSYPICVRYEKASCTYTKDGRSHDESTGRILFFEEIPIPESALKSKKWRAKCGESYFFVENTGGICWSGEDSHSIDNARHNVGNYFQTEKDANESAIYKAFHGEVE